MNKKPEDLTPAQLLEIQTAWMGVCVALVRNDIAKGKGDSPHAIHYRDEAMRIWEEARHDLEPQPSARVVHI